MGLIFPVVTKIVSNFLLLMCFWIAADDDLIGVNPIANLPDKIVLRTAYVLIFTSLITIIVWYLFKNSWGVIPFDFFEKMNEDLTSKLILPRFKNDKEQKDEKLNLVQDEQSDKIKMNDKAEKL